MKANYPVEFLAASMTLDMGNTDKLAEFRAEAERLGIKVEPPSVNRSGVDFEVEGATIHYALAALKGVGRQAVEAIVEARGERPFADLADFAARINPRAVNKRVLESLAAAGAFDALEANRARAFAAVDAMLAARAARRMSDQSVGQSELFGGRAARRAACACRPVEPWLPAERLQREFDAIGFFLSGHPLDDYAAVLKRLRVQSWAEFCARGERRRQRRPGRRDRASRAPSGAPAPAARWASSGCRIRPGTTRRSSSRKGWRNSATCSSRARRCC